ncbi:MAG: class I SAM-dependent methyltransferase [Acidimicrobiia bacterium]|nr:class I SAM-dependent methyltransferase [Acidimicrobiia bacterium]
MEADEWNRRYEGAELVWTDQANRVLMTETETLGPGRALDVGCGEGRNAVWLASKGWTVTAVDFSDVGLAKARRLAEAQAVEVEWVLADLRAYQPALQAYDLVVLLYVHLPPEDRAVVHAAAASALRPGGTMVVLGHESSNLTHGYGGPQDPSLLFSPDDVVDDLPDLSIVKADRVERRVSTESGERVALDALVRAVRPSR